MKHPQVSAACVVGVPEPNNPGNFLPKAFIILEDSAADVGPEELKDFSDCSFNFYTILYFQAVQN